MLWHLLQGLRILHVVLAVLAAFGFFVFCARTRFWLPKYVHVLAIIALGVGVWIAANIADNAPISRNGPFAKFLLALAPPVLVYFFFVFHGGQRAAFTRRFQTTVPCPYCKSPLAAFNGKKFELKQMPLYAERQCPHCGQTLA